MSDLKQRLLDKYPNDALERLVRSNQDYYSTHGDYVPELARLLLFERERLCEYEEALIEIAEWYEPTKPTTATGPSNVARVVLGRESDG
jgi:hypothetical protein